MPKSKRDSKASVKLEKVGSSTGKRRGRKKAPKVKIPVNLKRMIGMKQDLPITKASRANRKMKISDRKLLPLQQAKYVILATAVEYMKSAPGGEGVSSWRMSPTSANMIIEVVVNHLFAVLKLSGKFSATGHRKMVSYEDMIKAINLQGTTYTRTCQSF